MNKTRPDWAIDLIMHVFIQWLAHNNLLDAWLTNTVERVDRYAYSSNATFDMNMAGKVRNLRGHYRTAVSRSFTWTSASIQIDPSWATISREWEKVTIHIDRIIDGEQYYDQK